MSIAFKWRCSDRRSALKVVLAVLIIGGGYGCALLPQPEPLEPFQPRQWPPGSYQPQVDHFVVLFDASDSMNERYRGWRKFEYTKELVRRINQTLPPLAVEGGLRAFGSGACLSGQHTLLVYGMTAYSVQGLHEGLEAIACAGGVSPMAAAIRETAHDLEAATGQIAVIIIGDGQETGHMPALEAARQLQNTFGNRLCFYAIQIGDDDKGAELLERIAQLSGCGFALNGDDILGSDAMADFVQRIFLSAIAVADEDADGIRDALDQCPDTPPGAQVDPKGCLLDADGDGVADYLDECPETPTEATVNHQGCWILRDVTFETGKWYLQPGATASLDEVARILLRNPDLNIEVQGHTDDMGDADLNQALSENRANSVRKYLIRRGVAPHRLTARGYGFAQPAVSNATPWGRAQNRRVELRSTP